MHDKAFSPARVDVIAVARAGAEGQGELELAGLPRLAALIDSMVGTARWSVLGSFDEPAGREPEIRLHLHVGALVALTCQRCLEPLQQPLTVDQVFRFVRDPKQAEQLDEACDDEDVLELPRRLNLVELIEDELIMALPIVPRHEVCPEVPAMTYEDGAEPGTHEESAQPHPFAALAALRGGKLPT